MKEYGVFVKQGYAHLRSILPSLVALDNENGLSHTIKMLLEGQYCMLLVIDEKIDEFDMQIKTIAQKDVVSQRLQAIEGIGPITALAIIALVGNGEGFKNGRHFSAYLGLVPKQHSSGNRERLLGISKRGDEYLRTLLIHGGRAVVRTCSNKTDSRNIWINQLRTRVGMNKAAVAVANKNARIAMALLLSGQKYKKLA